MISTMQASVAAVGITVANDVVNNKLKIKRRLIGGILYLLVMAGLNDVNKELASKIALLVLIGTLMTSGYELVKWVQGVM